MSAPALLTPAASAAVLEIIAWYADHDEAAGQRFHRAIGEAARRLGARPLIGRPAPAALGQRRLWSLVGFPYLLIYDPHPAPPRILRVVHTARDLPRLLADLKS
ncbi:type II toxin-antitoxin system RelE/ParE family toxin [Roseomonas chloroacetimidivorans]|uniref:type II toxin-antitoxin system RelE/ParE family toxin n=1 Tax=Roseomonas chloroacetimidivorans TaxID=1766656 RepID=UPI003C74307E